DILPGEERLSIDILSPDKVTEKAEGIGVAKANNTIRGTIALGVLAGAFIAFAGEFYTLAVFDTGIAASLTRILGGLVFSLGLILVVITGAELFTGNTLLIIAFMTRKITSYLLLRNWVLVYIGNLVGALFIVVLVFYSEQWKVGGYAFGAQALYIAVTKVNNDWITLFVRGILANALVVMAVWLSYSGRSLTDKLLAVIFPITAFVSAGFEHSIANMYFIPFGIMVKSIPEVVEVYQQTHGTASLESLTYSTFIFNNLIPVTLGNIIGGSVLVGLAYWFVYLHKRF
ncbi:MAG: formate/nitrite transporter family protein, partial [Bacillota bacterium]|nr:formate/nitrite transporter family protein [Bacillota bacterium]